MHEAKCALLSTGGLLELGSLHTRGALFQESMSHQPRVHGSALTAIKISPAAPAAEATGADSCLLSVLPTERFYKGWGKYSFHLFVLNT